MNMEEYNKCIRDDSGPSLVHPEIPVATNFELKEHIFARLKDIPFFGKDHEDAYRHIDEVMEIANYFNITNVTKDAYVLTTLGNSQGCGKRLTQIITTRSNHYIGEFTYRFHSTI